MRANSISTRRRRRSLACGLGGANLNVSPHTERTPHDISGEHCEIRRGRPGCCQIVVFSVPLRDGTHFGFHTRSKRRPMLIFAQSLSGNYVQVHQPGDVRRPLGVFGAGV